MHFNDPRLTLSHDQHRARGRLVDAAHRDPAVCTREGCKGESVVAQLLPYVSIPDFFLVPTFHALLRGVVYSFLKHIFRPFPRGREVRDIVTRENRRRITQRIGQMVATHDFGRSLKCIIR